MLAERMLPFLWIRLVIVLGFTVFAFYQSITILAVVGIGLALLTGFQIFSAYRNRLSEEQDQN
ncbi:hypothetical protein CMUST_07895 [Corynebacterium mustelae]|uniref:Uncharacterized protein n=1 Tax=Corynebacterium mustelae TaxID=571915 RepID=A0A0G3GXL7_9CORY|nr:hypothetical protein [Corynebacterium mustelae]AKK05904.1 hypothetical protein CMUST_07895 [Corynebacterium mustelae]